MTTTNKTTISEELLREALKEHEFKKLDKLKEKEKLLRNTLSDIKKVTDEIYEIQEYLYTTGARPGIRALKDQYKNYGEDYTEMFFVKYIWKRDTGTRVFNFNEFENPVKIEKLSMWKPEEEE